MNLLRWPRKLMGFIFQDLKGQLGDSRVIAGADSKPASTEWEKHFEPFCKVVTASGAIWSCDGKGYWVLFKSNGLPKKTAVFELFEYHGIPARVFFGDGEQDFFVPIHISGIAKLLDVGLRLPVDYFNGPDQAKGCQAGPGRFPGTANQCGNADGAEGQKNGDQPCALKGSGQYSVHPCSYLCHGGSSSAGVLFGDTHFSRGLSPRPNPFIRAGRAFHRWVSGRQQKRLARWLADAGRAL